MLKIGICDDEEYFRVREEKLIVSFLKRRGYEYQIDIFTSGKELLSKKEELLKYHILFLDVNMDEIDGIETAKELRCITKDVYLVFVTGFVSYALEGYKVDAIRYILKDDSCLQQTIEECLQAIIERMSYKEEKESFLFKEGKKEIVMDKLLYIESNLHKLFFHMEGQEQYTMYEKLDVIEKKLNVYPFCRIHKSYLVNLKVMDVIERYQVTLKNGEVLNIAKPRYPEVRKQYIDYQGDL